MVWITGTFSLPRSVRNSSKCLFLYFCHGIVGVNSDNVSSFRHLHLFNSLLLNCNPSSLSSSRHFSSRPPARYVLIFLRLFSVRHVPHVVNHTNFCLTSLFWVFQMTSVVGTLSLHLPYPYSDLMWESHCFGLFSLISGLLYLKFSPPIVPSSLIFIYYS